MEIMEIMETQNVRKITPKLLYNCEKCDYQ